MKNRIFSIITAIVFVLIAYITLFGSAIYYKGKYKEASMKVDSLNAVIRKYDNYYEDTENFLNSVEETEPELFDRYDIADYNRSRIAVYKMKYNKE